MGMFDNYKNLDPNYIPDNRHKWFPCKCNRIVSGSTNTLVFELGKEFSEELIKLTIIFNQEERLIVVKNPSSILIDEHNMFVECKLDSTESQAFGHTFLDTLVQLKLEYPDKTLYTEIEKIKVMPTLDSEGETPIIPTLVGFGYTED